MASSLSNLVDNLTERIHEIKCKDSGCFLQYENAKGNLMIYKCLFCNGRYSKKLYEKLKKKFKNTFKFANNDINKFIFLVLILMNIWIIGKSLMKQHYLKNNNFIATSI